MKKTLLKTIIATSVLACPLYGASLALTFDAAAIKAGGTQDSFTAIGNTAGSPNPDIMLFTVSALDLAGDGSANDTVTATISIMGNTDNVRSGGTGDIGFGIHGGVNTRLDAGEILTFTVSSLSATFGSGQTDGVQFDGFSGLTMLSGGSGNMFTINGGAAETGSAAKTFAANTTLTVETTVNGTGNTPRVSDIVANFSSVPVPEPSSTALLGLGGLSLLLRRRK